jgi:hypothetical protein
MVDPIVPAPEVPAPAAPVETGPAAASAATDPLALDEAQLASFSPEQRVVVEGWKKRASDEIQRTSKTVEEKYKPHVEKSGALDRLVKAPEFQQWWAGQQQRAAQGQTPQQQQQIAQTKPQDFATPEEWAQAVLEASGGQPAKLQGIQQKMWTEMATPIVKQLQEKQALLETTMEMKSLFERHPDAKDLDLIGRAGADDRSPSLLEIAMYYAVDQQKKSVEEGYKLAKTWADALGSRAKQAAMGMIQEKKETVTAGPSTSQVNQTVSEVGSMDELIRKNLEALASGQKPPKFVIKR